MRVSSNIKALKMSFKNHKPPSIHHSDRGSQYTSKDYIKSLKGTETQVSMGLIAQDNAYAKRVNRTIKEEYLDHWEPKTFLQLKNQVKKAVMHYNTKRIHNGFRLLKMSPIEFEKYVLNLPKQNRPTETIYTGSESECKIGEVSNTGRRIIFTGANVKNSQPYLGTYTLAIGK